MVSPPALLVVAPETSIRAALDRLARAGIDGLPVMEGGALAGMRHPARGGRRAIQGRADRAGVAPW